MLFVLSVFLSIHQSHAYVLSRNAEGKVLKWAEPAKPVFYANWKNQNALTARQIHEAVTQSFQRWMHSGGASLGFDYYQSAQAPAVWSNDGKNILFFSSQARKDQKLSSSTLGITYVYSMNERIIEADIEFNDEHFQFSMNPLDSSQFNDGASVFLKNVTTHEIGHALGLGHSAQLHSSMVFMEARGQAHPSCDDIHGIAQLYPDPQFQYEKGSLNGTVTDSNGISVFGAHVSAISKARGTVIASQMTDAEGNFSFPHLEAGDYYLFLEPFQVGSPLSALCGNDIAHCAFADVNSHRICSNGASPFKRKFLETSDGVLKRLRVSGNKSTHTGLINVACDAMSDPWIHSSLLNAPTLIANNQNAEAGIAVRGILEDSNGSSQYFLLKNVVGNISIKALAFTLYSRLDASLEIFDGSGTKLDHGVIEKNDVFSSESGFINYDASLLVPNAHGDYFIRVKNERDLAKNSRIFPAGSIGMGSADPQVDLQAFYALIVTINKPENLSPQLKDNIRCEKSDEFSPFPDQGPGNIGQSSNSSNAAPMESASSSAKGTGCGFIKNKDHGDSGDVQNSLSSFFSSLGILFLLMFSRLTMRLAGISINR